MPRSLSCLLAAVALSLPALANGFARPAPWTLAELDSMARRGLIIGYSAAPLVVPANVTRYEVANLVLRATDGVGEAFKSVGESIQRPGGPPPPQVCMEDLARLEKLIAEFRTELVSLGTDVAKLSRTVSDLRQGLEATRKQVQAVAEEQRRHRISGYIQARWRSDAADDPENEFSLRRVRLKLSGPLTSSSYAIEVAADRGSSVSLKDAYISRAIKGWEVRAGQFKIPFGYEVPQSTADVLTPELAATTDRLFPDQRDRGIAVYSPAARVQGALAVVNGSGIEDGEVDNRKDVIAHLWRSGKHGQAGVSGYLGKWTGLSKTRLGLDLRWTLGPASLQAEYIRGRGEFHTGGPLLDTPVAGWYAQAEWALAGRPGGILFARREGYDPNRDAPGDMFTRTTLGWAWQPDAADRFTAAAEFKTDPANGGAKNAYTLQWQLVY